MSTPEREFKIPKSIQQAEQLEAELVANIETLRLDLQRFYSGEIPDVDEAWAIKKSHEHRLASVQLAQVQGRLKVLMKQQGLGAEARHFKRLFHSTSTTPNKPPHQTVIERDRYREAIIRWRIEGKLTDSDLAGILVLPATSVQPLCVSFLERRIEKAEKEGQPESAQSLREALIAFTAHRGPAERGPSDRVRTEAGPLR